MAERRSCRNLYHVKFKIRRTMALVARVGQENKAAFEQGSAFLSNGIVYAVYSRIEHRNQLAFLSFRLKFLNVFHGFHDFPDFKISQLPVLVLSGKPKF